MPIDTSSSIWTDQEKEHSMREDVIDFLSANPNKAFSVQELADALLETDWGRRDEEMSQWLDEAFEGAEGIEEFGAFLGQIFGETSRTTILQTHLSSLVYEGTVEVRGIPDTNMDDGDEVEIAYFTIAD